MKKIIIVVSLVLIVIIICGLIFLVNSKSNKVEEQLIMQVGQYVSYPNVNGYNGEWQVLRNNSETGFYEIVPSTLNVAVDLYGIEGDGRTVKASNGEIYSNGYNDFVGYLNALSEQYIDNTKAVSARHFGSLPKTPYINASVSGEVKDSNYYSDKKIYEEYLSGDFIKNNKAEDFWMASRTFMNTNESLEEDYDYHYVYYILNSGKLKSTSVEMTMMDGFSYFEKTSNLMPVISVKSNLKVISGDGSKAKPWVLE